MRLIAHNGFFKGKKDLESAIRREFKARGRPGEIDARDMKTFRDMHALKSGVKTWAESAYGKPGSSKKAKYCLHLRRVGQSGKYISLDREDKSEKTIERRTTFLDSCGKFHLLR